MSVIGLFVLLVVGSSVTAESEFSKDFKKKYSRIDIDLMNNPAEVAQIHDFVYQKDVATFTFTKGKMFLLRYIDDRPTTAIFIGEGHATVAIPPRVERMSLLACAEDSTVSEQFEVCAIRMADNLDLLLEEKFTFEPAEMKWREFTKTTQVQAELYFEPLIFHTYDNHFQLLRSVYQRADDGYFWADFNRYVFTFDPSRPEEVIISFEDEEGDQVLTEAAVFQRQERASYDNAIISSIPFPTSIVNQEGTIEVGGLDGGVVKSADMEIQLAINTDILRFVSLFLHYNLKVDSVYFNDRTLDYHRRGNFSFLGVMLPEHHYRGETLSVRLWYHGKDFTTAFPFVEDETVAPYNLTFIMPEGYNYLMPGMGSVSSLGAGKETFQVIPDSPFRRFYFQGYASGFDTLLFLSDIGSNIQFAKSGGMTKKRYACYIPDDIYQPATLAAFNYLSETLGAPPGTFVQYVYPQPDVNLSMPGLMTVPQDFCYEDGAGGFHVVAGYHAARQWFGALQRPRSYREYWLLDAIPQYLSLMVVEHTLGGSQFFSELKSRRNQTLLAIENHENRPLAVGTRMEELLRSHKGMWVIHMLRYLMYDLDTHSEHAFSNMLIEWSFLSNNQTYTNSDFIKLAEKHYGKPLGWFFDQWVYNACLPEFDVSYKVGEKDDGFYIEGAVKTKAVHGNFSMPVIMRIQDKRGEMTFVRETIDGTVDQFTIGPLESQPEELFFNEFFSVLAKEKVHRE
jgi:hypothetical protein